MQSIRSAAIILASLLTLGAAAARAADAPGWVKTSDENAQILLRLLARYMPENAARLGFSVVDDQILDLRQGLSERLRADTQRALEELKARRPATRDALVKQDLDILVTAAEDAMRSEEVQRQYMLPYRNVSLIVFSGIRFLLDPQIAKERQAAAVVRLKRYVGMLPDSQPIAQLARDRTAERFATPNLVGPFVDNVRQDLADSQRYIDGIRELLQKSALTGWQDAFDRLAAQLKDYDAWVRAELLPRARQDNRLPEPVYADNLRRVGVDMPPKLLMAQAQFSFSEIQHQMDGVALQVARQRGYASSDYRDVIRELKKQQITGEAIVPFYKQRLEAIEDIVRREQIVTLPQRKASIRLASAAETAAVPAPHMQPPQLIGNTGQYGEFVLPLSVPSADGGAELKTDDFTFDAVAWTITAHEARPGHELQFSAMVERGVSLARAIFAFNSVNVEGWGLYAEAEMQPYEPLEGQLIALQARLLRAGRAFIDPMLNLGVLKPQQARDFLMREVVASPAFAKEEVDRYTFRAPGQATSYYYGYMRLMQLRGQTEVALGDRFNRRKFNDFIVGQGLLPPDLMQRAVETEFVPSM